MVDLKATNQKLLDRGARIISHLTDLNYNDSMQLLKTVDGEVKTAIVMRKLNVIAEDARHKISTQGGSLRKAIGDANSKLY